MNSEAARSYDQSSRNSQRHGARRPRPAKSVRVASGQVEEDAGARREG